MTDSHGKKRIVHLLYSGIGGHGNVFSNLVNADVQNAFEYQALYYGIEPLRDSYKTFCQNNKIEYKYIRKRQGVDILFFISIFFALLKFRPATVFLHGSYLIWPVWLYKKIYGAKVIVRETQANHLKSKVDFIMLKWAIVLSDYLVFLTKEFKDQVCQRYKLNPDKKNFIIIPNGLNTSAFASNRDYAKSPVVLSMISRLVPIKDHETLIEAMVKLKDSHGNLILKIAGAGSTEQMLKEKTQQLGLSNIQFVGEIDENGIVELLKQTDIYVHLTFGETMSTSLMQAMSAGLPILSSDVPGVNNMIQQNKTGVLIPTKNVEAIVNGISGFMNDAKLRAFCGKNAKEYAFVNYDSKKMFEKYKAIIQ
jgi:glycosyltransferase involved in cell wall biosynthesis